MKEILLFQMFEYLHLYVSHKVESLCVTAFVTANLLAIAVFGGSPITVLGQTTNVGTIFYGNAMLGVLYVAMRLGKEFALGLLHKVFGAMVLFTGVSIFIHFLPSALPSDSLLAVLEPRIVTASYLAFYLGNGVLLATWDKFRVLGTFAGGFMAICFGQVVDSLIFYPIAFTSSPILLQSALFGLLLKIIIGVAGLPIVLRMVREGSDLQ